MRSSQIRWLDLRIELHGQYVDADWPAVRISTGPDWTDFIAKHHYVGFDPDTIFSDEQPLMPQETPRRVAIYSCGCREPGCGVVAPIIAGTKRYVMWHEFRDFNSGTFEGPLTDCRIPRGGRRLPLTTMIFERHQYEREVRRAVADRSWETTRRIAIRLLEAVLHERADELRERGYELRYVSEHWKHRGAVTAMLRRGRIEFAVTLRPTRQAPEEQTAEMVQILLEQSPSTWELANQRLLSDTTLPLLPLTPSKATLRPAYVGGNRPPA